MIDRRLLFTAAALASLSIGVARADDTAEQRLHDDWPWLGRYSADNARLVAAGARTDVVFMGDSITEGWREKRPEFFSAGRVCRGISGQTTPQMVLRMMADVVRLKPKAVHIMAGTNDIAGNTGPMTQAMSADNLVAMGDLARAHDIRVIYASVPPAIGFPWRPDLKPAASIASLNQWLKQFAKSSGAVWVDYHPVLATTEGGMRAGLAYDGVHPTAAGYEAMASVIEPILRQTVRS